MGDLDGRCFVKRNGGFFPADFAAEEMTASVADGREVVFTVRKARSPQHLRWFFAMLRKVCENTDDQWLDEEELLDDLKEAVGLSKKKINPLTGRESQRPGSISFAAMGEAKFVRFRRRCSYVLGQFLGCTPEELMAETDETQSPSVVPEREREPA